MKKIVSLLLIVCVLATALVACKKPDENTEKTYTLSIAVDSAVTETKVTNTACALVLDADGKIVAARFDCADVTLIKNGEVAVSDSVATKVEQGDSYGGGTAEKPAMPAGSWAKQVKAFEDYIVGKTVDEVTNLDMTLVAGCTMKNTSPTLKALVKKAADYTRKVSFTTSLDITLGIAISTKVSGAVADGSCKVSSDYAATVLAGDKVVSSILDSGEATATLTADEAGTVTVTPAEYTGTKNEKGDSYNMPAGAWYKQAQAYADSAVGKTVAELDNLDTVSDALKEAGCTMQNTTAGYKATIIKAAKAAR